MKDDWKNYQSVSKESFFSLLNGMVGNVAVVSLHTGCVYYVLRDTEALEVRAIKFGFRFDKRNLRQLVEKEYFYVNKKFLRMENDKYCQLNFAFMEEK